jgi:sugar transferase (PEP-CTERM/EpsH1 system associated)
LRVLFLSQIVPYPPHGGVLQRGYNLLREVGRNASVTLLAFVHPDELRTAADIDTSRRALLEFCESVEYFPLWPKASRVHTAAALAISAASPQPFSVIAHRSAAFAGRVSAVLQNTPPDIIHIDTLALCPFVPLDRRCASVLTHHNIESTLMARRAQAEPGWFARQFLRREANKLRSYEAHTAAIHDVNVVVSAPDAEALTGIAPGVRNVVVPNGVDIEYFSPDSATEEDALVYTGGMNMFANRDAVMYFLREIWPLIRARHANVRFYAVGQEPPAELRAFAESDKRVVVTGFVTDIRPIVRQAAVYVVPLRVGGGTRLKVLDAMAMGKAMVTTSIGCEGIDVRSGEHVIAADSPDQFAESTLMLLADRDRRLTLGRAARDLVERRYAWSIVGGQLLGAYSEAISAREKRG